jgi:hypothetical protein
MRRNLVFQLRSRQIYAAIGKEHLRHRRDHELAHIKTRLLALDFIVAHPEESYFETPEEKRCYFIDHFNADENLFLPVNKGGGGISFAEGFPLYLAYLPPDFLLDEAAQLFSFLVEGKGLGDLVRYFDLESKWEREQYGRLTEADVLFLSDGKKRFRVQFVERLRYLWNRNQVPKDFQAGADAASSAPRKIRFRALTMPGQEGVFGGRAKNWGDGWEIRGGSGATSPRQTGGMRKQAVQSATDA